MNSDPPRPPAGSASARLADRALVIALLVGAALAHGVNLFHYPHYQSDEGTYMSQAWAVLNLGTLSPHTYFYDHAPAGWIQIAAWALATGGLRTFGPQINSGRVFVLLTRLLLIFLTYRTAVVVSGKRLAGVLATLALAFSYYGIFFGRQVLLDNIAATWMVGALYLIVSGPLTLRRAALSGLVLGIGILTKEPVVVAIPPLAAIVWLRCRGERRPLVTLCWLTVVVCTASVYFLMAAIQGELFPAGTWLGGSRPHVSVIESLKWQASRDRDGGLLDFHSMFWRTAGSWAAACKLPVLVGTAAALALVLRFRRAPVAAMVGLSAVLMWAFFGRGGVIIYFYLILLLPLLALALGIGLADLLSWFGERARAWPRRAATAVVVAGCVVALGADYLVVKPYPLVLWRGRQADGMVQATDWVAAHVPKNSRIVLDIPLWNDLREPADGSPGFTSMYFYQKVLNDPTIRDLFQSDWRTVDYLITTPQLIRDAYFFKHETIVRDVMERSTPVGSFDTGGWPVQVFRVDPPPGPARRRATPGRATPPERGRVRIQRGTVVTDRGTLLRGATMELSDPEAYCSFPAVSASHWKALRDLRLNAVRFDVKLSDATPQPVTLDRQLSKLDRAVDLAADNGMYVIVMNSIESGRYNKKELTEFWSAVAPRYADRTHVLYEMTNEPVSWNPRDYQPGHVRDLADVYRAMRRGAPQTHIVLWTFPNLDPARETAAVVDRMYDVFYARESVGFHWYRAAIEDVNALKRQYPLFMTETSPGPPTTDDLAALQNCERAGVSWVHLEGKHRDVSRLKQLIARLNETGFRWDAEWDNPAPAVAGASPPASGAPGG